MPCPFCKMGTCLNSEHSVVLTYEEHLRSQRSELSLGFELKLMPIFSIGRSSSSPSLFSPPERPRFSPFTGSTPISSLTVHGVPFHEYMLEVSRRPAKKKWTPPPSDLTPVAQRFLPIILDSVAVHAHLTGKRHCVASALVKAPTGRSTNPWGGHLLVTSNQPSKVLRVKWSASVDKGALQGLQAKKNLDALGGLKKTSGMLTVPSLRDVDEYRRVSDLYKLVDVGLRAIGNGCQETTCQGFVRALPNKPNERQQLALKASEQMLHAEMRILDMLWAGLVLPIEPVVYIGVSMPCCADCTRAVAVFNQLMEGTMRVIVAGSHEGTTKHWQPPAFLGKSGFRPAGVNALECATMTPIPVLK